MSDSTTAETPQGLSVLVADDDAVSRMVVSAMLRRDGHSVDTAIDGVEAVEAAARHRYDLILMDLQMPELDGVGAMIRIRSAGTQPRRLVALTATVDDQTHSQCSDAGADEIAQKPLDATRLRGIIAGVPRASGTGAGDSTAALSDERFESFRRDIGTHVARPFAEVVGAMLDEMRSQSERLVEAADRDDREAIARAAHTLRGSSGTVGANGLAAMMADLEQHAVEWPASQLRDAVARGRDELERVATILRQRA